MIYCRVMIYIPDWLLPPIHIDNNRSLCTYVVYMTVNKQYGLQLEGLTTCLSLISLPQTCHDHHRSVEVPTPPLSNHVPLLDTVELVLAHQVEKGASLQAAATEADAWREEGGRAKEVEEVF